MTQGNSDKVERAKEILSLRDSSSLKELQQLEVELRGAGNADLADQIETLREQEIDQAQGNKILSAPIDGQMRPETRAGMLTLAKRLVKYKDFSLARRLLARARYKIPKNDPNYDEIYQKSALYTYKDADLQRAWQFDEALKILGEGFSLSKTENQETLGIAGGIYKRKWQAEPLPQNLESSLFHYLRGYTIGLREEHVTKARAKSGLPAPADVNELAAALQAARADVFTFLRDNPDSKLRVEEDKGYCGINAAFTLDVLAQEGEAEAKRAGIVSKAAAERREGARLIREEITRSVTEFAKKKADWWVCVTLGEAFFGLGNYAEADYWLIEKTKDLEVEEWQYESTARQLAALARLQSDPDLSETDFQKTPAAQALRTFLKGDEAAVLNTFRGKFGLGLSGGGFRASLFHIGVLAKLAELGVLPHIEVLSCVSGGSIIGAHYYLEVRKLLQTRIDGKIQPKDYVDIVERIQNDFLDGVQRNIRTRVLAEWFTNLKMIFSSGYTRTLRVGELYERELYSFVRDIPEEGSKGERFRSPVTGPKWLPDWMARGMGYKREERWLNDLYIHPKIADNQWQTNFSPRKHNWRRINKAPDLVLNATTLNTGHTWQFTASFMGEPPAPIVAEIDANYRLRRMYYKQAPARYRKFRLGYAVAASSCVPGLFEPLILDGLYPDDPEGKLNHDSLISVRLVDGGACDNQGIASLMDQDCTVMLISDASGQMEAKNVPGGGPLGVLLRTTNVVQARVRESEYEDVSSRLKSARLRSLMFIHLRQDLPGGSVAWKDCPSTVRKSDFETQPEGPSDGTGYGVAASVQRKLAAIRTDLDSFSQAEAYGLMASAYRMTEQQFEKLECVKGFTRPVAAGNWRFLAIEPAMEPPSVSPANAGRKHLEQLLDAGSNLAFKVWMLSTPLIYLKWALLIAPAVGLTWLFYEMWNESIIPPSVYAWLGTHATFRNIGLLIFTTAVLAFIAAGVNAIVGRKYGKQIMRVIRWRDTLGSIAVGVGMSTVGFIAARVHLHIFDRMFINCGKLEKFPK